MRRATAALLGDCHVPSRYGCRWQHDDNQVLRLGIIISIHALHEESDFHVSVTQLDIVLFQSTLSMRRATGAYGAQCWDLWAFQSTLSMRRATKIITTKTQIWNISIHALHEESDETDSS